MHRWVPGWPQLCTIVSSFIQINSEGFALSNCPLHGGFGPQFPYLKQMQEIKVSGHPVREQGSSDGHRMFADRPGGDMDHFI